MITNLVLGMISGLLLWIAWQVAYLADRMRAIDPQIDMIHKELSRLRAEVDE